MHMHAMRCTVALCMSHRPMSIRMETSCAEPGVSDVGDSPNAHTISYSQCVAQQSRPSCIAAACQCKAYRSRAEHACAQSGAETFMTYLRQLKYIVLSLGFVKKSAIMLRVSVRNNAIPLRKYRSRAKCKRRSKCTVRLVAPGHLITSLRLHPVSPLLLLSCIICFHFSSEI